jgi:hypothetical protein
MPLPILADVAFARLGASPAAHVCPICGGSQYMALELGGCRECRGVRDRINAVLASVDHITPVIHTHYHHTPGDLALERIYPHRHQYNAVERGECLLVTDLVTKRSAYISVQGIIGAKDVLGLIEGAMA